MSSVYRWFHYILNRTLKTATTELQSLASTVIKEQRFRNFAEDFKKKSSESHRFRNNQKQYNYVVRCLINAEEFTLIEEILQHQKQYISSEGFAVRLLKLYGKAGMFDHAHKLFDELPELNCRRTVKSFNALLSACVSSKEFHKLEGLFLFLPEKLGVEPDLVTYNTVIKGLCEMGSLDGAVLLLDEMEEKHVEPNYVTFNTLLSSLYGKGKFSKGEKVWDRMLSKNVEPDVKAYNAKLFGLALERKTEEALELVEDMKRKGVEPDVYSMSALIKGFSSGKSVP